MRELNEMIRPVPPDLTAVPAKVREAGDELAKVRGRYSEVRAELGESKQTITEAQTDDAQAVRNAVAAGKSMPKPKAQAAVERAAQLERQLEALRVLAIEAEDRYMSVCRALRDEWRQALEGERVERVERLRRASRSCGRRSSRS